jgi:ABC-type multidrug transport system fused ATPase/permease subunit
MDKHSRPALARTLGGFLRPYTGQSCLLVALLALQAAGTLFLPYLSADVIDNGVVTGDTGYIWRTGAVMLAVAFAACVVAIPSCYLASRISTSVGADLRAAIFSRVQAFSAADMNRFGIPTLVTRNINDVQQVQMFLLSALTLIGTAAIMCVGGVIMAVRVGGQLSLLLAVAIPAIVVVIGALLLAITPMYRRVQAKVDQISQVLRDQITGVRVVRAFGRSQAEERRFRAANADLTGTALRINQIFVVILPVLMVIITLSLVAVVWFGGHLVSEGSMPIGNLIAFLSYLLLILSAVVLAVMFLAQIPHAVASGERIVQVTGLIPAIADQRQAATPARITGAVEFRQVSFGYPGSERQVLRELTFRLEPGQTSAIIGGTGSGKTTVLNLIPRFLDTTGGAVLVNGADVRAQAAEQLWSTIGMVPQPAFLFRGTIASNLRFACPEATDEQLWHALDVAQAADFVARLPGQLDAQVDQGGTNVSGGQRQRLAIARALVRRPSLYVFDDCFSALDLATEARLRAALRAEAGDATMLIVAQRISSIMGADQIIMLEDGIIAGIGTHEQLLASCASYREIADSQLGEGVVV